jgi:hypothetical protein
MVFAGMTFALTHNVLVLTIAAILGTISPSGSEVGPFLSIEQAILPQILPDRHRTQVYAWLFTRLSGSIEVEPSQSPKSESGDGGMPPLRIGVHQSRGVVGRLSALFMLDSFGGGLMVQTFMAYGFAVRFGVGPAVLGGIFFGANLCAGISALAAARLAARVWTHQHHGLDAHSLQRPVSARAVHAQCDSRYRCAPDAVQHFSDGCADPAIVHHGRRGSG